MITPHTNEILDYFNAYYDPIKHHPHGNSFQIFNARMLLTIHSEITFPTLPITGTELKTHVFTSKLSESWFAYETLLPIIKEFGFQASKPKKIAKFGSADTIQDAIALHRNFASPGIPFGSASTFDDSRIDDAYLEDLMHRSVREFFTHTQSIRSSVEARDKVQAYLLYLEHHSKGLQKDLLLLSYNAITNGDHTTAPYHIMSIAYAVRNQYVHAGEIFSSGIEDLEIKSTLLAACFVFVTQYALIVATQLIIHAVDRPV